MKLKKVYCSWFPFKGYVALTLYPWVFIRKDLANKFTTKTERHELIHAFQQVETLWIGFMLLYCIEYIIKLILCGFNHEVAYRSISFEYEAYVKERYLDYSSKRKKFAWLKYVFKLKEGTIWLKN